MMMTQFDLFAEEQEVSVSEMEKTLSEMENFVAKFEKDERFFNAAKAFNWETEFSQLCNSENIFEGFDAVVGNPPYFSLSGSKRNSYFEEFYTVFSKTTDIYALFIEKATKLLKSDGFFGFITSNKYFTANYGEKLRKFILKNTRDLHIFDFVRFQVFPKASVDTAIIFAQISEKPSNILKYSTFDDLKVQDFELFHLQKIDYQEIDLSNIEKWNIKGFKFLFLKEKLTQKGIPLKNWNIDFFRGITTGFNEAFLIDKSTKNELIAKDKNNKKIIKPILRGRDIKKYHHQFANLYLILTPKGFCIENFPVVKNYLSQFYDSLCKKGGQNAWYELQASPSEKMLQDCEKKKIIFTKTSQEKSFSYDNEGYFLLNTAYFVAADRNNKYLLAVLNSKLITFAFLKFFQSGGIDGEITVQAIEEIPIPQISEEEQKPFISFVDKILKAKKKNLDTSDLEKEIDKLVYKLYDLTDF